MLRTPPLNRFFAVNGRAIAIAAFRSCSNGAEVAVYLSKEQSQSSKECRLKWPAKSTEFAGTQHG
jgi:hypothetical protein